jgi:hypothetical protein
MSPSSHLVAPDLKGSLNAHVSMVVSETASAAQHTLTYHLSVGTAAVP